MFYSLRGTYTYQEQNFIVIECSGVGYQCSTSMMSIRDLPNFGNEVTVYTHLAVREDAVELFGFTTTQELNCFRILVGVSGVGSKVALAILSEFTPEQLAACIVSSDSKSLTRASGVGNKIAQRIVLELKDKMKKLSPQKCTAAARFDKLEVSGSNYGKAVEALAVLGYSADEVEPVLSKLDTTLKVEELIRMTLVEMGKR